MAEPLEVAETAGADDGSEVVADDDLTVAIDDDLMGDDLTREDDAADINDIGGDDDAELAAYIASVAAKLTEAAQAENSDATQPEVEEPLEVTDAVYDAGDDTVRAEN